MNETPDRAMPLPFPLFVPYGRYLVFLLNMLAASDKKGRVVSNHTHPYCECIVVKKGRVSYLIGRDRYTVEPGEAIIIPPNATHVREAKTDCSLYAFHLTINETNAGNVKMRRLVSESFLLTACNEILEEVEGEKPQWVSAARHTLAATLIRFCRSVIASSEISLRQRSPDPAFLAAIRFVNDNIRSELAVPAVARASGVSDRHLSRLFSSNIGLSPQNYILEKKLFLAYSDLITGNNATVREIAHGLAFYDAGYFARVVKEKFGLTPTEIQALDH